MLLKYGKYCVIVEEGTFKKDVHKAAQNVPKIEKKESHNWLKWRLEIVWSSPWEGDETRAASSKFEAVNSYPPRGVGGTPGTD